MSLDQWLAFVAATIILLIIPGPTTLLVVSHALSHGRAAARATVAGVALGDVTAITASIVGLGALLAASATLFTAVKVAGAAYLIVLGIRLWRAPVPDIDGDLERVDRVDARRLAFNAWSVTVLNPKGIVFFVAFLPQFVSTDSPLLPQLVLLMATFVSLSLVNSTLFGALATRLRGTIRQTRIRRTVNRTGGSMMIGAGVLSLVWRR